MVICFGVEVLCCYVCFHILLKVKGPGPVRTLDALNSDCVELCTVLSKCAWLLLELTLHTLILYYRYTEKMSALNSNLLIK